MTNPNTTLIAALLDRSGSMSTSVAATEDGWRELIDTQRGNPGLCFVTLAQFDTDYEVLGGFNWSSQHHDQGGVVWQGRRTRSRSA